MKIVMMISMALLSFGACAKDKAPAKKITAKTVEVANSAKAKVEAPCDSKEDLLKKLEEKKKAEASIGKGFSLQGGDTGCSVK